MDYKELASELTDLIGKYRTHQRSLSELQAYYTSKGAEQKNNFQIALQLAIPKNIRKVYDIMMNTTFINEYQVEDSLKIEDNPLIPFTQQLYTAMWNNQDKVAFILKTTDEKEGSDMISKIVSELSENEETAKQKVVDIKQEITV